jgi:hypothetical protein
MHRLSTTAGPRSGHPQCLASSAQVGVVRHREIKTEKADERADQSAPSRAPAPVRVTAPSVWRSARWNTARSVSAVRMASGEYQGWLPRFVRGSARQAAIASSLKTAAPKPDPDARRAVQGQRQVSPPYPEAEASADELANFTPPNSAAGQISPKTVLFVT